MEIQSVKRRIENCGNIRNYHLSWSLTEKTREEQLQKCFQRLRDSLRAERIAGLNAEEQAQMMEDVDYLSFALDILPEGMRPGRFETLLQQIPMCELMRYQKEKIRKLLLDASVPDRHLKIYLEEYMDETLSDAEKTALWNGLDNFLSENRSFGEEWISGHKMIFLDKAVAGKALCKLGHYEDCMERYGNDASFRDVLAYLLQVDPYYSFDDSQIAELSENPDRIRKALDEIAKLMDTDEMRLFVERWLDNHALRYDAEFWSRKLQEGPVEDIRMRLSSSAAYIAFCYNEAFPVEVNHNEEGLVIFAVTRRKKAFLSLIKSRQKLLHNLPDDSLLFDSRFYSTCINLNTLNEANLQKLSRMRIGDVLCWAELASRERTFQEILLLYDKTEAYFGLEKELLSIRIDDRLKIMREIANKSCIDSGLDFAALAEKLREKPLSNWMKNDFRNISGLEERIAVRILCNYASISHLIPEINKVCEARYVLNNLDICFEESPLSEIIEKLIYRDPEWQALREACGFSDEFVSDNIQRVREFVLDDGAHIMQSFLRDTPGKEDEVRRLVTAELLGRFREMKYYEDDLQREIDYSVSAGIKHAWTKNFRMSDGELSLWEEDGLLPVMTIGEIPQKTCLSYETGVYKDCLLACHDANKKVLFLSLNGTTVLRAAIRLTKGKDVGSMDDKDKAKLQFADFSEKRDAAEKVRTEPSKEQLILFLERSYVSGLPQCYEEKAYNLIFQLMKNKAGELGAQLVVSKSYQDVMPANFAKAHYFVYISQSKAGRQYLDSMNGANQVSNEGTYRGGVFYFDRAKEEM